MLWSPAIRAALIAGTPQCLLPTLRDKPGRSALWCSGEVLVVSGVDANAEGLGSTRCRR
jgi:hypothetical protein